jgi:hypothetical protein
MYAATSSTCAAVKPVVLREVVSCPVLVTFDVVVSVAVPAAFEFTLRLVSDKLPPEEVDSLTAVFLIEVKVEGWLSDEFI